MYYSTKYSSPVGLITLACDESGNLIGLWLEGQKHYGASIPGDTVKNDGMPIFSKTISWLERYFANEKPATSQLPISPVGSEFRKAVWGILCEIPYGETVTYGDIAKSVAAQSGKKSMSSQAVGGAVGHNPISIIIPCHRVVGAGGSLTGYAGGLAVKKMLLELEGVDTSKLFIPKKGTAL